MKRSKFQSHNFSFSQRQRKIEPKPVEKKIFKKKEKIRYRNTNATDLMLMAKVIHTNRNIHADNQQQVEDLKKRRKSQKKNTNTLTSKCR